MNSSADSAGVDVAERALHRRAVEAVVWGMPAVNYRLMYEAAAYIAGPGDNRIVFWPSLPDARNQTLTPNPDVVHLMPFIDTREVGPVVLEIPPAEGGTLDGSVMNAWKVTIEDIDSAGADPAHGGRYLVLPPDFDGDVPHGYTPLRSDTHQCHALLHSIPSGGNEAEVAQALDHARGIRLYPLARADDPPETTWIDADGAVFDAAIPYDIRFFQVLDRIVQEEPWLARDRVMIDHLRTIGIEKGEPFAPDATTRTTLAAAAAEARSWLDASYESTLAPITPDSHWRIPTGPELTDATRAFFEAPESYPIDARAVAYSFTSFTPKRPRKAPLHLMAFTDLSGHPLDGAAVYRLTVPARTSVDAKWSTTAYDRATHTLIRDMPRADRSSQSPGLAVNEDGSVHVYFAPEPPPAGREFNWVPTDVRGHFEVMFRSRGATAAMRDGSWRLPDLERVE